MLHSLATIARCARPYLWSVIFTNCLVAGVSLSMSVPLSLLVAVILSFLASAGFLLNDLLDRQIDKVNKQGRLEDASVATRVGAGVTAAVFAIASLVLTFLTGESVVLLLTLSVLIGLVLYNVVLRRIPFVATAIASCLCASPLWFVMGVQFQHVSLPSVPT